MSPTEATILALQVRAEAIKAAITAMQAVDLPTHAESTGHLPDDFYMKCSGQLHDIANQIITLAREL